MHSRRAMVRGGLAAMVAEAVAYSYKSLFGTSSGIGKEHIHMGGGTSTLYDRGILWGDVEIDLEAAWNISKEMPARSQVVHN